MDWKSERAHGGAPSELEFCVRELLGAVAALEARLAGQLDPRTAAALAHLARVTRHLSAARDALAGTATTAPDADSEDLQGETRAESFQDLLCFLATGKKTGVLRVVSERERFLLQLRLGAVVYANGDAPPKGESLSELLAARGVLSAELLGRLPERTGENVWVDRNLLGTSWISREHLGGAIQDQTRLAFFRLCAGGHLRFRFYENAEIENIVPVKNSAMELLLEYSRSVDERRESLAAQVESASCPALFARRDAGRPSAG